jgi:hypothetical protein
MAIGENVTRVSIYLDRDDQAALTALAKQYRVSLSKLLRVAVFMGMGDAIERKKAQLQASPPITPEASEGVTAPKIVDPPYPPRDTASQPQAKSEPNSVPTPAQMGFFRRERGLE